MEIAVFCVDPHPGGVQQGTNPLAGDPIQRQPALYWPHCCKASWDTEDFRWPELFPTGGAGEPEDPYPSVLHEIYQIIVHITWSIGSQTFSCRGPLTPWCITEINIDKRFLLFCWGPPWNPSKNPGVQTLRTTDLESAALLSGNRPHFPTKVSLSPWQQPIVPQAKDAPPRVHHQALCCPGHLSGMLLPIGSWLDFEHPLTFLISINMLACWNDILVEHSAGV